MQIITQEMLAENFIKNVLFGLWAEYINDKGAHEAGLSFDSFVWLRLSELGQAMYESIGKMYGDLDEVM